MMGAQSGVFASQPQSCSTCKPQSADHYLNFGYFSEDGDTTSTLTLNNNQSEATDVKITFYNSKGEPFRLAPISLPGLQISRFSVRELTKEARGNFKSGNAQVFYHGPGMGVTGQITVTSVKEHLSFESGPTEAMMFSSTTLDGIVWLPDEKTRASIAITNTSSSPITVTAGSGRSPQIRQKAVTLGPRETQVLDLGEFIDGRKDAPAAALVKLTHSGAVGDLIMTGFALNEKTGFACNINFIDRSTSVSNHLAGAHFRFGPAPPEERFPAGTTFRPPLVIANAGDLSSGVKIAVDYTINAVARRVELAPITLAPQEVRQIDLAREMERWGVVGFVDNAGLDIDYTGAAGSVIGRLTSVDTTGDYSFETPIKDPLAGMNRVSGSHPWRLDQGYNTILHLKNTIGQEVNAIVQLRFKSGTYNPELIKLAPYQTVALDIKQMRDAQQNDIRGGVIPKDVTSGQVIWYERTLGSLIGRAETFDVGLGVSSSFSCSGSCPCPSSFNSTYMSPSSITSLPGDQGQAFLPMEMDSDCHSSSFGPFNMTSSSTWSSTNTSVATVSSTGLVSYLTVGQANILASFTAYVYGGPPGSCNQTVVHPSTSGGVTVSAFTPHHLKVLSDTVTMPNCPDTIQRRIVYQVVDVNSNPIQGQCLGCLKVKETFTNMTNNTCGGPTPTSSNCRQTTGIDGRFTDTLTAGACSGSANCGFSMTQDLQWCPPTGSPVILGRSQTTVHRDEIIVAGNSTNSTPNLAGKFLYPDGTVRNN